VERLRRRSGAARRRLHASLAPGAWVPSELITAANARSPSTHGGDTRRSPDAPVGAGRLCAVRAVVLTAGGNANGSATVVLAGLDRQREPEQPHHTQQGAETQEA